MIPILSLFNPVPQANLTEKVVTTQEETKSEVEETKTIPEKVESSQPEKDKKEPSTPQ